jgi:anti-sigma B factor antagonist
MGAGDSDLLRIEVGATDDGSVRVVRLGGQLDMGTADSFQACLTRLMAESPADIAIDLDDLEFIDSTGLRIVIGAWREAMKAGRTVTLHRPRASVARVLTITGLDKMMTVEP